ncbi:MAG: metallophosphoesterase family protein [Kiritimatiellia bacterium]|nr:metallophosphoesterase family protein [Kiritimatiellia bacterium]
MRYAIVSDIHANWQAWNVVLLDIRSLKVDCIICLGDMIGYGPNPCEVLESVHTAVDYFVLGNHDAALCGKLDSALFNTQARLILDWTQSRVSRSALDFLKTIPLSLAGEMFRCVHGEFSEPGCFNYVFEPEDALRSWQAVAEPLLFNGHTHRPGIFLMGGSGKPYRLDPEDFELEHGKRFLVNVGSVGNPRDSDARASYCIYDLRRRAVFWRKIPFDLDAYRQALNDAGLPVEPSGFLKCDPRLSAAPLRAMLNFSPPASKEQAAKDVIEVQVIKVLKGKVQRWRFAALGLVLAVFALIFAGLAYRYWNIHREIDIGQADPIVIQQDMLARNILPVPDYPLPARSAVPGWVLHLGDKYRQSIEFCRGDDGELEFRLLSDNPKAEIGLSSGAITVTDDMKFVLEAFFRKSNDFDGSVWAVVSLVKKKEAEEVVMEHYVVKEPTLRRQGGWSLAKQTFDLPKGTHTIRLHVRGKFKGAVSVKNILLQRKTGS